MINISDSSKKAKAKFVWADNKSALKLVSHNFENSVSVSLSHDSLEDFDASHDENPDSPIDDEYVDDSKKNEPRLFNQDDFERFSKREVKCFGLDYSNRIPYSKVTNFFIFRPHHEGLSAFFKQENDVCFCTEVGAFIRKLEYAHMTNEWWLCIDLKMCFSIIAMKNLLLLWVMLLGWEKPMSRWNSFWHELITQFISELFVAI